MSVMASQITGVTIFYWTICSAVDQIFLCIFVMPLWREFTSERWIPHTKRQQREKCFHLTTSWCHHVYILPDRHAGTFIALMVKNLIYFYCPRQLHNLSGCYLFIARQYCMYFYHRMLRNSLLLIWYQTTIQTDNDVLLVASIKEIQLAFHMKYQMLLFCRKSMVNILLIVLSISLIFVSLHNISEQPLTIQFWRKYVFTGYQNTL